MADMVDIPTNVLVAMGGVGTTLAGAVGWSFKSKQAELDRLQARYDALLEKYHAMLASMVESEPARKDALLKIAQTQENLNTIIKERLRPA